VKPGATTRRCRTRAARRPTCWRRVRAQAEPAVALRPLSGVSAAFSERSPMCGRGPTGGRAAARVSLRPHQSGRDARHLRRAGRRLRLAAEPRHETAADHRPARRQRRCRMSGRRRMFLARSRSYRCPSDRVSKVAEPPDLLLHLAKQRRRKLPQSSAKATIIDRSALVDHDLAFAVVSGDACRNADAKQALAREPRGAGNDPGGRMRDAVQQVRL